MIGNTDVRTSDTKGLLTSNFSDNYTILGKHFSVETVYTVLSEGVVNIVLDPRLVSGTFISVPTFFSTSAEHITMTLGVCTSYTGGTAIIPTNRNYEFKTSNPAKTVYTSNPTVTGYVASPTSFGIGVEGTQQNAGGGVASGSSIIVLDKSLIYVFRTSAAPGALNLTANISWYEV